MHYYIYPAGKTGKTLGKMIDYCGMSATYSFIDDNQEGLALREQAHKIKTQIANNEAEVIIALTQGIAITQSRTDRLIRNLKASGIDCYRGNDFIKQVALIVCQKAQLEVQKLSICEGGVLVGVILYGLGGEKHLGNIDYELLKRDCKIVYLDHSGEDFIRMKDSSDVLVIPFIMDYLSEAHFVKYIYSTTSTYTRNANQVYFVQHHSYAGALESLIEGKIDYYKMLLRDKIDYLFAASNSMGKAVESLMQDFEESNKPNVLISGYAAFDLEKDESKNDLRDVVLIALHDEDEVLEIQEGILELLENGIKVALRYRYEWNGNLKSCINAFKNYHNFYISYNNEDFKNFSRKSFVTITSASGMAYTFPIKHLCPAILYFKDKNVFSKNIGGIGFFDDRIHLKASNSQEVVSQVKQSKHKDFLKKILQYRNEEVVNFRKASGVIADNIVRIINGEK